MTDIQLLYVTCASVEQAQAIGQSLVKDKLAACVNILPAMQSIYEWEGTGEQANEVVMIVKTTADGAQACQEAILSRHEYDCPCILQIPVSAGHPAFLDWIKTQCER